MARQVADWRTAGMVAGTLLLLGLNLPSLAARALANGSLLLLTRSVIDLEAPPTMTTYPPRSLPQRRYLLGRAATLASWAEEADGSNAVVAWTAGRVALARGEPGEAVRVLDSVTDRATRHEFLSMDLLDAYRRAGRLDEAIRAYEQCGRDTASALVREHAATVYLLKGRALLASGDTVSADATFRRAAEARPADLAALRYLLSQTLRRGESEADELRTRLRFFPLESIEPTTEALGALTGEAMLGLYADDEWQAGQLLNVLAVLVWRHPDAAWVGDTLMRLADRYPDQPEWRFHLGEWHQRRDESEQAIRAYYLWLRATPADGVARRRVQRLEAAAGGGSGEPAATAPKHVEAASSDDRDGTADGRPSARPLGATGPSAARDHDALVSLLGEVPPSVTVGPNLVDFGDFGRWNQVGPSGWRWLDQATSEYSARGLYVNGRDDIDPWTGPSVRISGLWNDLRDSRAPGAFGLRPARLVLEPRSAYLMTCSYRSARLPDGEANIYVSDDPMRLIPGGEILLPATGGDWRRVAAIVPNHADREVAIVPLLRSSGAGDVWFDDFALRKVDLPPDRVPRTVVSSVRP